MDIISFSADVLKKLKVEKTRAYTNGNLHKYRVIEVLLWIGDKDCMLSISDIAGFADVSIKTIYNWMKGFIVGGFTWLLRQWFRGRGAKSKLSAKQKEELYQMIQAGPQENGFDSGLWNSPMIAELIWLKFGVKYNPRYLCRLLKGIGISYQKAKFESDKTDDDEYKKARKEWEEKTWPKILEEAKQNSAIILFGDEVSFAMWGSLSRTWAPIGKQPTVKTKGCRKGLKMFGAIEFESGKLHFMESVSYCIKAKTLKQFKGEGLSSELLTKLKELKDETYKTKEIYLQALNRILGEEEVSINEKWLLKHAETSGAFNGETYAKFLQQILDASSSRVILIEDGAPYHRSRIVKDFVEHQDRLTTVPLPTFSPDFNPIEKLWKNHQCPPI
jgi:transposase